MAAPGRPRFFRNIRALESRIGLGIRVSISGANQMAKTGKSLAERAGKMGL
jgi:hypothetical protein